jgi:hypothetical protein
MKFLKFVGIPVLILFVLLVIGGFFLSGDYIVKRTIEIEAPPDQIAYYTNDLAHWPEWTPWLEMDPTIVTTLGDQTTGVGAHQSWTSKDGSGELTFTRADTQGIEYDMAFITGEERWPAKCSMNFQPNGSMTTVTWGMTGTIDGFVGKYFALLMPGMIKADFDKGLEKLKAKAEALPPLLEESGEL